MTYLYETIPSREGETVRQYEIKQAATDAPLTRHPETGEAIRRVILGGWGLVTGKKDGRTESQGTCGCGPTGCC